MPVLEGLHERIAAYHGEAQGNPHHRYRSWEHCYRFFRSRTREELASDRDTAGLHLGMYLASWGMFRASGFLMDYAYTIHARAVDFLVFEDFDRLWACEFGASPEDAELIPLIDQLTLAVRAAYEPFGKATDTLVTKVILGTVGCLPACDRFFIDGFRRSGLAYPPKVNRTFAGRILQTCQDNIDGLRQEQARIEAVEGMRYPLMKLLDMYFWQVGFEANTKGDPTNTSPQTV